MKNYQNLKKQPFSIKNRGILLFLFIALLTACALPVQTETGQPRSANALPTTTLTTMLSPAPTTTRTPSPTAASTATAVATATTIASSPAVATPTAVVEATAAPAPPLDPFTCSTNPVTAALLKETSADGWLEWVKRLSGAEPVTVGGRQVTFTTRYTRAMFGTPGPNAFDFVLETVRGWYSEEQIKVQRYTIPDSGQGEIQAKNLILTIPGMSHEDEVVILSAHLDSISRAAPEKTAPGAEDNASGSAALLEAARLLRGHRFERTIRIIWFTGEEEGMLGSKAYVKDLENPRAIKAVINLDMFGYDSDNDRCFEIHAGTMPESNPIGRCFIESIAAYNLGLPHPDFLTNDATSLSDHGSFWSAGVGAIEILENMFDEHLQDGCQNADKNSGYHTPQDTYDRLNPDSAIRIVRAALATTMAFAGPLQ